VTFGTGLDWYFNGSDGYQPPITPADGTPRPDLLRAVGYQAVTPRTPKGKGKRRTNKEGQ
jgi:hypothetical protein